MVGMTTQERMDDICKISGLSEEIVRRVLNAEKESIVKSLKRGERATLIGRVSIRPELKQQLNIGGEISSYVKLYATPSSALESMLSDISSFEETALVEDEVEAVRLYQIPALN